jgi:hypothetical protein
MSVHLIAEFKGKYHFLSNFYIAPVTLWHPLFGEQRYPTTEHAYQAAKCENREGHDLIQVAGTPGNAKRMGAIAKLRPDWEQIKDNVMTAVVGAKFAQHDALHAQLLATGDAYLMEGNEHGDKIWGCVEHVSGEWIGENRLGRILMKLRKELRG